MELSILTGNDREIIIESQKIRRLVFVEEQHIPEELDFDGKDDSSFHTLAALEGKSVGTARLTVEGKSARLARIAVLPEYRGMGIAGRIIRSALLYARDINADPVVIHAHEYLQKYYESFGFRFVKNVETVGKHQLIEMTAEQSTL